MLGRFLVAAIAAGIVWKYRDSLRDYVKGTAPAREKIDGLLRTVQENSAVLLDQAKEQLSSRIEITREKVRAGASEEGHASRDVRLTRVRVILPDPYDSDLTGSPSSIALPFGKP